MCSALVLTLAAVALTVLLRDFPERAFASERETAGKSPAQPLISGESDIKPWRENARPLPATEVSKDESSSSPAGGELAPGVAPVRKTEEKSQPEPLPQPQPQAKPKAHPESKPGQRPPTVG